MATRNYKMKKTCLRGALLGSLAAAVFSFPAASDPARTGSTLDIGYTIAFWNIPIGHTDYEGTLGANSYSAKAHFETGGVVGVFWKSVVDATVNGGIGAHSISPAVYDSNSQNHNRPLQQVKVTFQKDDPTTFADPPYDTEKYPISEAQKKGTVDPMSALTSIFTGTNSDEKHPCGNGVQVFDGRRRYDVRFTYVKDEVVKLGNGLFNGTAHLCEIHYDAIAGYPQSDAMAWQTAPKMFADVVDVPAADASNGRYVVAVKIWSVRSLGTMTVTLDSIKVDGAAAIGMIARN
jgi:hypothetical protein